MFLIKHWNRANCTVYIRIKLCYHSRDTLCFLTHLRHLFEHLCSQQIRRKFKGQLLILLENRAKTVKDTFSNYFFSEANCQFQFDNPESKRTRCERICIWCYISMCILLVWICAKEHIQCLSVYLSIFVFILVDLCMIIHAESIMITSSYKVNVYQNTLFFNKLSNY